MALKNTAVLFMLLLVLLVVGEARHTHPKSEQFTDSMNGNVNIQNDYDTSETELVNIVRPKKNSPLGGILFFKSYDPCDDGFKLDFQGVCREVWF